MQKQLTSLQLLFQLNNYRTIVTHRCTGINDFVGVAPHRIGSALWEYKLCLKKERSDNKSGLGIFIVGEILDHLNV